MLTDLELVGMQQTADTALPDVGRIDRPSGSSTLDVDLLSDTPTDPDEIYVGAMKLRPPGRGDEIEVLFGDEEVSTQRYMCRIPHDAPTVERNDIVRVTQSSDGEILNRTFRVRGVSEGGWHVGRLLAVEVVLEP